MELRIRVVKNECFLLEVNIHTSLDISEKMMFVNYTSIKLRKKDERSSVPYDSVSTVALISMVQN